jgi:CheY-like chemotaxis protein
MTRSGKYSDPGSAVHLSAKSVGDRVEIRVRDHGIGIESDLLDRVFDAFVQQPQALDRSAGGLGLGLAIVKNLVTAHGGSVRVESAGVGTGSEFVVSLPAISASDDAAVAEPGKDQTAATEPASVWRVLVVDDNEDGAELLAHSLQSMGHRVRVAHDDRAALDAAATFHPDVALLDIGLPVMDGYELASRIRDQPGGRSIYLVAVTGYGQQRDRAASRAAGFAEHVVKPVDLERLREIIAEGLASRHERRDSPEEVERGAHSGRATVRTPMSGRGSSALFRLTVLLAMAAACGRDALTSPGGPDAEPESEGTEAQ